jgi:hypothetical protein
MGRRRRVPAPGRASASKITKLIMARRAVEVAAAAAAAGRRARRRAEDAAVAEVAAAVIVVVAAIDVLRAGGGNNAEGQGCMVLARGIRIAATWGQRYIRSSKW